MSVQSYRQDAMKYITGLVVATLLTVVAYGLVTQDWFGWSVTTVAIALLLLAALQVIAQVVFFLHLGEEKKPRWKTFTFGFTILMLLVIVIGSLWVMKNLDYRMGMSPDQMDAYMREQNGKGF